jgi:hypothetical protein
MRRRRAAGNQKHPDVFAGCSTPVEVTPTQIMQRIFHRLTERAMDTKCDQAIEARALVNLIEMGQWLSGANHSASGVLHGRAIRIVQNAFHQI